MDRFGKAIDHYRTHAKMISGLEVIEESMG